MMPTPPRPGESKEAYRARVAAAQAAMKAKMEEAKKRGYRERGPFTVDVTPGRDKPKPVPTPVKPGKGKPTPVRPGKPGKPVLYSGSGMKRGGTVKGKK